MRFGGSARTETEPAWNSMNGTIQRTDMRTGESESCSSDQGKNLSSEQKQATQCLCGGRSSTPAANAVSIAPSFVMRARIEAPSSYDKLTQLLTRSGLVAGITPTSERERSSQLTLDFASYEQGGSD